MTDLFNYLKARGFLIIGDIHLSSRKPGTRKDENFVNTVLNKIEQIIAIANREDLIPVFQGDIFDTPKENDEALKTRFIRILKKSKHLCYTNVGNHDISGDILSDGDSLAVIGEFGNPLKVISKSGPVSVFEMNGLKIGLGMTPYGQVIPNDVTPYFDNIDGVIWITHHDIAFEGSYPGAMEPYEIKGCSIVANGHMHLEKKPIVKGETTWINHGSVVRTAKDAAYHAPTVTGIIFEQDELVKFKIDHQENIFNMAGRMIDSSPGENVTEEITQSVFVKLLSAAQGDINPLATDNGEIILESLKEKFEKENTDQKVRLHILNAFEQIKNIED